MSQSPRPGPGSDQDQVAADALRGQQPEREGSGQGKVHEQVGVGRRGDDLVPHIGVGAQASRVVDERASVHHADQAGGQADQGVQAVPGNGESGGGYRHCRLSRRSALAITQARTYGTAHNSGNTRPRRFFRKMSS